MSYDAESLADELRRRGHSKQAEQIGEMVNDQDRIYARMNAARARMELQVKADEIKGALINKIMAEKAAEDGLNAKVAALETSDPQLWAYIRKLEYINQQVWCPKCEDIKNVPGFHERKMDGQCPTCAGGSKTSAEVELAKLKDDYAKLEKNFQLLSQHMTGLNEEFQNKISQTLAVAVELQEEINAMRKRAADIGLAVGGRNETGISVSAEVPKKSEQVAEVNNYLAMEGNGRPDFSVNGIDIDELIDQRAHELTADLVFGNLNEEHSLEIPL